MFLLFIVFIYFPAGPADAAQAGGGAVPAGQLHALLRRLRGAAAEQQLRHAAAIPEGEGAPRERRLSDMLGPTWLVSDAVRSKSSLRCWFFGQGAVVVGSAQSGYIQQQQGGPVDHKTMQQALGCAVCVLLILLQ